MTTSGKTIAKNAGALFSSQVFTWVLTLIVTIALPRYLGADVIGQFYLAGAVWGLVGVLVTFGMDTHLIKAIARAPETAGELLGTSIVLRFLLFAIGCVGVAIYLRAFGHSPSTIITVVIIGVSQFLMLPNTAVLSALQGLEVMEYVSLASVVSRVINTSLCLLFVFLGFGVYAVAGVGVVTTAISLAIMLVALYRRCKIRLRVNLAEGWALLRASAPYLVVSITLVSYLQINALVIASVIDTRSVSWYTTANTLYGTLLFVPTVLATALFPSMSRSHAAGDKQDSLAKLVHRGVDLLLLLSLPMSAGIVVVANNLVTMLYGQEFAPTGLVLGIMALGLPFTFLNILFANTLIAADRPHTWSKVMIVSTGVMFLLAVTLVPWSERALGEGAVGGALGFLLTEMMMTIIGVFLLPRGLLAWSNVRALALTAIASIVMAVVCWPLRNMLPPIPILAGIGSFVVMVAVLRIVPPEDLRFLQDLGRQLWRRIRPGPKTAVSVSGR